MTLPSRFLINQEDEGVGSTYIKTKDDYLDKVYRADYVTLQQKLTEDLSQLADTLKTITDKSQEA